MKNIRAYLTIAVVSLMLVVVSAFSMSTVGHQAAVCVPLLFGLLFCWSAVKAMLAQAGRTGGRNGSNPFHRPDSQGRMIPAFSKRPHTPVCGRFFLTVRGLCHRLS